MTDRVAAWFRQARQDVAQAARCLEDGSWEWAGYISQQGVEKALKGAILATGIPYPHIRSLPALAEVLTDRLALVFSAEDLDSLKELSQFNVMARYPIGDEAIAPIDAISSRQAARAVDAARDFVARIAATVSQIEPGDGGDDQSA